MVVSVRTSLHTVATAVLASTVLFTSVFAQSEEPIITYHQQHPLISINPDIPMVSIYADGTAVIYRDSVYRNPGEYRLQLSSEELNEILRLANSPALSTFNEPSLQESLNESNELFHISDPTTSLFEFTGELANGIAASGAMQETLTLSIAVDNVVSTAERLPNFPGIRGLEALHRKFVALFTEAGE